MEKVIIKSQEEFNNIPYDVTSLCCEKLNLSTIPPLNNFTKLEYLFCSVNNLTELPALPESIKFLECDCNKLINIVNLPENLQVLSCVDNNIINIELPRKLKTLYCSGNLIDRLPVLPTKLKRLYCSDNLLENLPKLPDTLEDLYCHENMLKPFKINNNITEFSYSIYQTSVYRNFNEAFKFNNNSNKRNNTNRLKRKNGNSLDEINYNGLDERIINLMKDLSI